MDAKVSIGRWRATALGLAQLACVALGPVGPAEAGDEYPARTVRFVQPFQAAGPADVLARLTAEKLAVQWGRPVIVDNVVGATGSIGAAAVAKAPADGYTLLFTPDIPLTMYPAVARGLGYDPQADFKPVGILARSPNAVFVNSALGVSSVAELVALAKAQPSKLTFSSAGVASPAHFAGELFRIRAGIDMTHVPYKGAAPAMAAVLSGEASVFFGPIPQGLAHVNSGKVRALAVTDAQASPLLPGVKPLVEQGFPELVIVVRYVVLAPAHTPDAVVRTVGGALKRVLDEPALRSRLHAAAITPEWEGPEQLAQAIGADLKRWRELAQRLGLEPN